MTASTPRLHDALHPDPAVATQEPPRRTLPVLFGALAVALLALAVWWSSQQDARNGNTTAPVAAEVPAAAVPPAAQEGARGATAQRTERARPVVADRGPRPLAGNPMPEYPRTSLRSGAEGMVLLNILVDASGTPVDVEVVQRSGVRDRNLDRAAIDAVRQWRFEPAIRGGKAVSSSVQLPVDFRRG